MNYRDDLDDFKLNSHLESSGDDWQARRYPTNSAYKKGDHKRSSYSDTDHLDLSPEHRSKSYDAKTFDKAFDKAYDKTFEKSAREDELSRPLDKKYDLYKKDSFNDNYKDASYKETGFKEISYKDTAYKDAFKETPYKDTYKDSFKETYKDPYKENYNDNELSKAPDRKYNDLDKKFSSASEHSADYRNLDRNLDRTLDRTLDRGSGFTDRNLDFDFGDEKKPLSKRPSNPYEPATGKAAERKLDYRRSSEQRKSLDKFDVLLDSQLDAPGKITIDLSKDRYRSSLDDGRPEPKSSRFNLDDYFPNSDTDAGAREKAGHRKNSDFDKYSSDSLTNAVKGKYDKYDKYASRNLDRNLERNLVGNLERNLERNFERNLDKQYDFGDGILDEIRRLELKEEVRKNEIMSELKNAENILKHQNNHKFLHKADSLDNQIKIPSNLAKTSSESFVFLL